MGVNVCVIVFEMKRWTGMDVKMGGGICIAPPLVVKVCGVFVWVLLSLGGRVFKCVCV